jgi:hypothetical protein
MEKKNNVSLGEGLGALAKIVILILLFWAFVHHAGNLNEFDNRRANLHSWISSDYKDFYSQTYVIVRHMQVEYPLVLITRDDQKIPEGKIEWVPFHQQYPVLVPFVRGTGFAIQFLKDVVDNEASLFNAHNGRHPTVKEMNELLEKVPYYGYVASLLFSLSDISDVLHKTSHPNNFGKWDIKKLDEIEEAFLSRKKGIEEVLTQNPSTLKIMEVTLISPSQDI